MSGEDDEYVCGEPLKNSDGYCENTVDGPDEICGTHENFGTQHELNTDITRGEYYQSLPKADKNWIDEVSDDLLDKSYYDEDDVSMVEKCRQIAVDLHQKRRADGYVAKKGLTQEQTTGFHEQYGKIEETQENVLMVTKDRLSRESRLSMKDLGILDEETNQGSSDASSLLEQLSSDMES